MKLHKIAWVLLIIGGLNWLLVGLFSTWDLASLVTAPVARIIYILVGLSALYLIFFGKKRQATVA